MEEKLQKPMREEDLTEDERMIFARFSSMVRQVLSLVDLALPTGSKQHKEMRRQSQNYMYECRNDMLANFTSYFERFKEA